MIPQENEKQMGASRPIRFRAWDDTDREMSHFSFTSNLVCIEDKDDLHICSNSGGWSFFREGLHIMQFTGLKDKNGREIYEGDIVRRINTQGTIEIAEVKYKAPFWNLNDYVPEYGYTIIGNIYENPELLKEN